MTSNGKAARYDADYYEWANDQAAALRGRKLEMLDFEHLAEEVEGLAKRDRRELRNRLTCVLVHLLKCQFQPARLSRSWEATLLVQRDALKIILQDSPSLRGELPRLIEGAYVSARKIAAAEMRVEAWADRFPRACPWRVEQVLDADFSPKPAK